MESQEQQPASPPAASADDPADAPAAVAHISQAAETAPADLPAGSARNRGYVRRVVGSTFNYGIGKFLPQLVRFLLLPVFTRFIPPSGYGLIELSNRFGAFLTTSMKLGVPGAVTRFYFDYPEGPRLKDYVTTVAWFVVVCSLCVTFVTLLIGPWALGRLIPELPFVPFALLAIVSAFLLGITELQDRMLQAREQSAYAFRLNVGRASLSIVMAVLFVVGLRLRALGLMAAEVASYGVLAFVAVRYLKSELSGRFRVPMLKSSLAYGMAMMPGDFVSSLTPLISQAILANEQSISASGILGMGNRFSQPLIILAYGFQTAFLPIYYSIRKESTSVGTHRLAVTARNVWALAIFCALGAALLGPWVLVLMTPKDFHPAASLLPILAVYFLGMVIQSLFGPEVYYSKQTWWVPVVVYSGAAIEITVSALTARRFGPEGVALASTTRMVATAILFAIISMRLVKVPHQWGNLVRITLCGIAVGSAIVWLPHHHGLAQVAYAALALAAFPLLLWATGDPSIREGLRFGRRIAARVASGDFS